jgi:CrcB protein
MKVALIAVAGAAGVLARFAVSSAVGVRTFPWATLAVNVMGSCLLGALLETGIKRQWPENAVIPLSIGFLGGFTTFSTFSYETFTLMRTDRVPEAMVYVVVSVVAGVLAAGAGFWFARRLA